MSGERDWISGSSAGQQPDRFRLSSSFPRQRWSQLTPSHSSPVVATAAGPSNQASPRRLEPALDESARAYRTTALRQLNGNNPRPWPSRAHRQNNPSGGRSSMLVSQPVLVRTYSGNTDENRTSEASKKPTPPSPSRRSFPFIGVSSSSEAQDRRPELPSDEAFGIDDILRAIEPNIQNTLDSIAEIYGRSKLSLANEYSSHIAPLGEIRAPPGYLVTVDEASSDQERQPPDGVDIYGDEQDQHPFSYYGEMENTRQASTHGATLPSTMPLWAGDRSSVQAQPDTPRSSTETNLALDSIIPESESIPVTKEFTSKPRSCGRALLGKRAESIGDSQLGPAVVSEVYLDAQAESPQSPPNLGQVQTQSESSPSVLAELQGFFGWITHATRGQSDFGQLRQPAEVRLRAMLNSRRAALYHAS